VLPGKLPTLERVHPWDWGGGEEGPEKRQLPQLDKSPGVSRGKGTHPEEGPGLQRKKGEVERGKAAWKKKVIDILGKEKWFGKKVEMSGESIVPGTELGAVGKKKKFSKKGKAPTRSRLGTDSTRGREALKDSGV